MSSVDNVVAELRRRVERMRTQQAVAAAAGVSQGHISEVVNGVAEPSEALARFLGYERRVTYVRNRSFERASRQDA